MLNKGQLRKPKTMWTDHVKEDIKKRVQKEWIQMQEEKNRQGFIIK